MATNSQPQETPEYHTFREHYDRLVHAIQDPLPLATQLFSKGIITSAVKERMIVLGLTTLEKNNVLLSAVEKQIQSNPGTVHGFLSALNEDPSLRALVESVQGGLMSTTSGTHGGGESRVGSEEQSTPAVKRKCVRVEENTSLVPGLERESIHGESPTFPRYFFHRHQHQNQCQNQQHYHSSSQFPTQPSYHPPFHPPLQVEHPPPHQYQSPVQPHIYQPPHYPGFSFTLEPPSHQCTEPSQHSCYQPPPNPPPLQYANLPTSGTPHQQPYYQSHYQVPVQPAYMYQPPYQHPTLHHSSPSLGQHTYQHPGYHKTSTFQSSHLPFFDLHSFCHASFQAPHQQPIRWAHSQHPPPPHSDNPLRKYALFLRGYYTQHHAPCTKWPPLDTRKYINLAVINNVHANRADLVKFRKQTIRGSIDDILEWKAPIAMSEILKPNCLYGTSYPVTQLLIEGAPGIGKSTFAWEVCQKWGQHQLFNEYSLVVLLKFRDRRVQEAKTVSELFYHPNSKLQSEIDNAITETGGQGLLLILEGFDEAPASKRAMDSIFVRLFRGQELPKATVILTTRPSASGGLWKFCNSVNSRRIEIVGFGKKEIDEYIQCASSDERSQSDFKQYLSLYPHIHSMMYVPLNSAIVTHVYESCKSSGVVVPKTMTQLYSSLIRTLLLRYLKDKEEYKDTCTNINSFKDLPQPVYDQFCKVCKIAYTGIMGAETELIFQDLPSDFDSLGLMQTCPELYVDRGASVSYNFLHLTVQEYLAAYHISQQSRDEQVAFMREHIESMKLEVVVRFLAGLTELGSDFWDVVRGFASTAKPIRPSLMQNETNFIKLISLHCVFESQDISAITCILGSDCVCFSGGSWIDKDALQPFDLYVLGYCITHSSCDWKLELERCELESVEILLKALNFQQEQCQLPSTGRIRRMQLSGSDLAAGHLLVDSMPKMLVFSNLTHLGLRGGYFTSETCNLFSKHIHFLQHLEYLELGRNPIGNGGAVNLITSLTRFSTIRELKLDSNGLGFEDCKALSDLLASSKFLKVVDMYSEVNDIDNLSPDSVQSIVDSLFHNTSLEKLNMYHSDFSSENVFHLASVLRVNSRLKKLDIGCCNIQSSDSVHLAKALEENTTTQLQTLVMEDNPIGSEGAVAFANMLATNESLTQLNLSYCSVQREGAVAIASVLERNPCLKSLILIDDSVGVEGALELIKSLKHNTTLKKLWLSEQCKPSSFSTLEKELQDRVRFGE